MSSQGFLVALGILLCGVLVFLAFYFLGKDSEPITDLEGRVVLEREVIGGPVSGKPYSPAIKITRARLFENGKRVVLSETLYVSGQIAIDPATGEETRDDIAAETRQVLNNLKYWVEAAGFSLQDAARCTVFLADIDDYARMNEVYVEFFPSDPPARECVAVREIVKGFRVEISLIADR
jgi:2-iminobutanoate/2-iminopropanoate deaminase